MQEIFCAVSAGQWPIIFFPPLICAHHEKFDRLSGEFVLRAFDKKVVPAQRYFIFVDQRLGAEIYFSNVAAAASMASDDHEQVLAFASIFSTVRFDAHVVAQRAALKNVIPRGDV